MMTSEKWITVHEPTLRPSGLDRDFTIAGPEPFRMLVLELMKAGHAVREQDIPGLFRIDGGPELTFGQFMQVGRQMLP